MAIRISVDGTDIKINKDGYVSLTDIAKRAIDGAEPITALRSWLKNSNTLLFLQTWEKRKNENFKLNRMVQFRMNAADNRNYATPQKYIRETGAIGMISKSGKYGGTYAHTDIALNFCYWLSPEFQVYMIEEFQRLKAEEQLRLGDPFNIKRYLTSGNYSLMVSALISQVDERLLTHPQPYKKRLPFASESDMLNEIVFGKTASEWRRENTDKPTSRNQRDYASLLDLVVLNNLEFLDAMLIQWKCEKEERKSILKEAYNFQYPLLKRSSTIEKMEKLSAKLNEK